MSITKLLPALVISTLVSALAGFLFGYDNIVISGAIHYLSVFFRLGAAGTGWAAGCALVGCVLGAAAAGSLADRFGLKLSLNVCAVCFALSSVLVWAVPLFPAFIGGRILGGIGIGAASIVAPMYMAEIAPVNVRGRLVVLYQLGIVLGILCAVFVNLLIERSGSQAWNTEAGWRLMFLAGVVPAVLFALAILCSNESPRWLMKMGREPQALAVLTAISGQAAATSQTTSIRNSLALEHANFSSLFRGTQRTALLTGIALAAFTQLSGITSVLSFLPDVLKAAGQSVNRSFFQTVLVGAANVVFTCLAIWLVERAGRKILIMCGTAIQTAALLWLAKLYYSQFGGPAVVAGIMLFVAGHAIGNGAVCWVIIAEIFPTKLRGVAMSIATTALWIAAYLANQFFPLLQKHLGDAGTFFLFAIVALANFLFVWIRVPETRGYALEDNSTIWHKHTKQGSAA